MNVGSLLLLQAKNMNYKSFTEQTAAMVNLLACIRDLLYMNLCRDIRLS
jgi:hypothetical protein